MVYNRFKDWYEVKFGKNNSDFVITNPLKTVKITTLNDLQNLRNF